MLDANRRDYDEYRRRGKGIGEEVVEEEKNGLHLNALLRKNVRSVRAGDAGDVTEEVLVSKRTLIITVAHEVPVPQKSYMELFGNFATEGQLCLANFRSQRIRLGTRKQNCGSCGSKCCFWLMTLEKLILCETVVCEEGSARLHEVGIGEKRGYISCETVHSSCTQNGT